MVPRRPPIHALTTHDVYAHEKTRKIAKASKLSGVRKVGKKHKEGNNMKIVGKKQEKRTRR